MPSSSDPIHRCIEQWHRHLRGELDGGLDAILHDDVVFWSPIVFTPQRGKDITTRYLAAAGSTLGGEPAREAPAAADSVSDASSGDGSSGVFRYTREILDGHDAVLEFETTLDGKYVNGIDMIRCDDDGQIVDFKVMIRPLQAINAVHAAMKAMLEQMSSAP